MGRANEPKPAKPKDTPAPADPAPAATPAPVNPETLVELTEHGNEVAAEFEQPDLVSRALTSYRVMLAREAKRFIKQNVTDGANLAEDVIRAILTQQLVGTLLPTILKLGPDASDVMHATVSELLAERDAMLQLVAKAEAQNTAAVARVRGNAAIFAAGLAKTVLLSGAGLAVKILLDV